MHRDDLPLYQAMEMQASFLGVHPPELTDIDQLLKEGDVFVAGDRLRRRSFTRPVTRPEAFRCISRMTPERFTGASTIHTVMDEAGEKIALTDLLKKAAGPEGAAEDLPPMKRREWPVTRRSFFPEDTLFCRQHWPHRPVGRLYGADAWIRSVPR